MPATRGNSFTRRRPDDQTTRVGRVGDPEREAGANVGDAAGGKHAFRVPPPDGLVDDLCCLARTPPEARLMKEPFPPAFSAHEV